MAFQRKAPRRVYVVVDPEQIVHARVPAQDYAEALQEPGVFATFKEARAEAIDQIEIAIASQMRSLRFLRKMKADDVAEGWTNDIGALLGN